VLVSHPLIVVGASPPRPTLREALGVLRASPALLGYLAVVVTVSFATDPINTEGPAFAHEFGLSSTWAGAIVGAFGIGAVTAGATVAGRVGPGTRTALTLALMGCGIAGLGLAPWFPVALGLAAVAGFGYLSSNAAASGRSRACSTARSPTWRASVLRR
jgi:hypothetical protein